jgi:2-polyprenyl-6-methoxyphenol hydroxylase-like FAD-dependent oxidoreductase
VRGRKSRAQRRRRCVRARHPQALRDAEPTMTGRSTPLRPLRRAASFGTRLALTHRTNPHLWASLSHDRHAYMHGHMIDSEALVIGGGPVGLFAALCLLERGVSVRILDAGGERAVRGYACGLHPETLRLFDRMGLMPSVLEAAQRVDRLLVRRDSHCHIAELDALDGKYPYALTLRQFELEEILRQALERRGAAVHRHHAVMHLYRRHGFVNVTGNVENAFRGPAVHENSLPTSFEHKAHYVVGADGYFSVCRRTLGVELTQVRPTRAFAVCEFNADLRGWERDACLSFAPDSVSAFWPLGPELGRFTFQVFEGLDESLTLDTLRELIVERAPWFTPAPEQLCWGAVAPFEHALAQCFGDGRIWLAGDAAHSTSPIGFQSMNRGFCEVHQLAAAIAGELFDPRPESRAFVSFEREQQAEWVRLFGLWPRHAPTQWHVNELAPCLPASGEDFEALVEQLGAAAQISQPIF